MRIPTHLGVRVLGHIFGQFLQLPLAVLPLRAQLALAARKVDLALPRETMCKGIVNFLGYFLLLLRSISPCQFKTTCQ